ncbi:hypothetical protein AK88_05309 [Plasmodium fragile]|uniref:Schizont-infected cell agglutination extracellular alpha domain-containing protein n=1 Tax=Plasmodium fragile TaxID=5857 RepID=A0A0D9QDJ5_PLAFR|nr:uncharacterized protein AK88_05309 [Plasmodium fragile]KJP85054.1 hypothetical protein AK88_05309 [Plasmodium fragile]
MQDKEWEPVQDVLQDFIEYLKDHNEDFDALGANCDNTGWDDMDQYSRMGQRVADMMRCRLMSGALWFANGDNIDGKGGDMDEDEAALRCEVAHVLGHLLKERYCKDQQRWPRGIEYAWQTFRNMKSGQPGTPDALGGPVIDGQCTPCGYTGYQRNITAINLAIAQWLLEHGNISAEIAQMQDAMPCNKEWQEYLKEGDQQGDRIKDRLSEEGKEKIKEGQKELAGAVIKIIKKVQEAKDDIMKEAKKISAQAQKSGTKEIGYGKDMNSNNRNSKNTKTKKPEAPPPKVPKTPKEVVPEDTDKNKPPEPGSGTDGRGRSDDSATRSIPQPPPAAPPRASPPGPTADGSEKAGKKSKSTCGTTTDTETKEVNGNTATITITTVESSSPECSGSGTPGIESN